MGRKILLILGLVGVLVVVGAWNRDVAGLGLFLLVNLWLTLMSVRYWNPHGRKMRTNQVELEPPVESHHPRAGPFTLGAPWGHADQRSTPRACSHPSSLA
jgi:hypothetical protein